MIFMHPRSCNISFMHFPIFFIKTPIWVWLKSSETHFHAKEFLEHTFAWFWKGLQIFLQIVVFVWQINAYRVYDKVFYYY
jgi:hypothetical protein